MTKSAAKQIAGMLLDIQAVKLNPNQPFRWISGWNSPIYCDNRLTLSYPKVRNFIREQFVALVQEKFAQAEVIAGVATAGIPHGMLLADQLNLPFIYVRSKPKEHGLNTIIEGKLEKNQKVIVIEDLISTGKSSLEVVDTIKEHGGEVLALMSIFNYDFEISRKAFAEKGVSYNYLCDYQTLLVEAVNRELISENDMASLQEWRLSPESWRK
ncbi:MAG: orotate phosphoribosyltransferase [Bacteroidetes bacterium]|nr:MAG: orotate phosphoribosyltransferase [Bacteroidota bacterium]